jgi:hypothetical protein
MKRLFGISVLVLLAGCVMLLWPSPTAQVVVGGQGITIISTGAGAPSGNCSGLNYLYLNTSNGNLYSCPNPASTWTLISGGGLPSGLTYVAPTFTISSATNGNGVLALSGNTSGTATLTAPAVAGTTTNPLTVSNVLQGPSGTVNNPTYGFSSAATGGMWYDSADNATGINTPNGTEGFLLVNGPKVGMVSFEVRNTDTIGFSSTGSVLGATDTGLSRGAADVVDCGNGTAADTSCQFKAAGVISVGTKFTTNNGCTDGANAGGATAGYFVVGSTSCTEIVTMGNSATAPNGWSCTVVDITTLGDVTNPHQTTSSTTTATFVTGTVVSGDKIQFSCIGY